MRILIVDDNPDWLDLLLELFGNLRPDWKVESFESGSDALAALKRTEFDLVLADMKMPVVTGADVLAEAAERSPGSVRFILTASSGVSCALAHRVLRKGGRVEDLVVLLEEALVGARDT